MSIESVRGLLQRGWHVLPIWWPVWDADGKVSCACGGTHPDQSIGKHPIADLVPDGQNNSSNDEAVVRGWFERYPQMNVAVDLARSGLMALDVDHPDGPDAAVTKLQAAIAKHGPLPETTQQVSGSGCWHVFFRAPMFPIRGQVEGITVRGKNYTVVAPSLHKSGGRYHWEEGCSPDTVPIAELPAAWLVALRRPDPLGDVGVPEQEPAWLRDVPAERRLADMRAQLERETGEIMGHSRPGLTRDIIKTAIRRHAVRDAVAAFNLIAEVYNPKCDPPYGQEELANRIVFAYETAHTPEWGEAYEPHELRVAALAASIGYVIPPRESRPVTTSNETMAALRAGQRSLASSRKGDRQLKGQFLGAVLKGEPLPSDNETDAADAEIIAIRTLVEVAPKSASAMELAAVLVRSIPHQSPDELARAIEMLRGHIVTPQDEAPPEDDEEVRARLAMTDKGPRASGGNIEMILRYAEKTRSNIHFDELTKKIHIDHTLFHDEPEGCLDTAVAIWLEREWGLSVGSKEVGEQIQRIARKWGAFNPVADYLEGLSWDGVPRVNSWLIAYCHAETVDQDGENIATYVREVGQMWLIGAVARALDPGCKMDTVLVLEGKQGAKKSSAFGVLGGKWFSNNPLVMGDKDSYMLAASQWICELAELASLARSATESQKAFLSSGEDKFRPPYGREIVTFRRRCVFGGTVNPEHDGHTDYLKDTTGDRRWWPVRVSSEIALVDLRRDRDQLWAEAVHLYKQGVKWWYEENERMLADRVASKRHSEDPWEVLVFQWAERQVNGQGPIGNMTGRRDRWSLADFAEGALGIAKADFHKHKKQLSDALHKAGFTSRPEGRSRTRLWQHASLSVPKVPEKAPERVLH